MLIGIVAALIAALAYGTASVLQARGAQSVADPDAAAGAAPSLRSTITAMLTVTFLGGLVLDGVGFISNLVAARIAPLFLVQPIVAANLAVTAVLAAVVLRIALRPRDWAAIGVIVVALVLLGVSAGTEGHEGDGRGMHWAVLIAGVVLLLAGLGGIRLAGGRVAVPAGLLGGVLFGVMTTAVRIVDGLDPVDLGALLRDPAAYAIVLCGVGGFYLFTVALQTGSVSAAAASLVVGETVIPGVVGVALLGDTFRSGWMPVAIIAFLAAVVGAVAIATSTAVAETSG